MSYLVLLSDFKEEFTVFLFFIRDQNRRLSMGLIFLKSYLRKKAFPL